MLYKIKRYLFGGPAYPVRANVYGLWQKTISLEHPPGSDEWEQTRIEFLIGGPSILADDADVWFPYPKYVIDKKNSHVLPDGVTRRFQYVSETRVWRATYELLEETTELAGITIPMGEEPIPIERRNYVWDDSI